MGPVKDAAVLLKVVSGCADESMIENMLDGPSSEDPAAVCPSGTAGSNALCFVHHHAHYLVKLELACNVRYTSPSSLCSPAPQPGPCCIPRCT